jgi:hypothetical protein
MSRPDRLWSPEQKEIYCGKIDILTGLLLEQLDGLFDDLGIKLAYQHNSWTGPCPIHGGDNPQGLCIYTGGRIPGYWQCRTHHCQEHFPKTILGFIRGVLSAEKGWNRPMDERVTFRETTEYACRFLGVEWRDLQVDTRASQKRDFARQVNEWTAKGSPATVSEMSQQWLQTFLEVPSPYFVSRGYSAAVLERFGVGDCWREGSPFCGRAVVPVYLRSDTAIGLTGRSVFPVCRTCSRWHDPKHACEEADRSATSKWRNSKTLRVADCLYNWPTIAESRLVGGQLLLVEGPGCVWRAAEAGYDRVCATFGAHLSERQQILLETSGVREILVAYDRDEAGEAGFQQIQSALRRVCRVRRLLPPSHDIGGSSLQDLSELFRGLH